jgi:hypothetical protein
MKISIYDAWVVYYTMDSFSPSLAVDEIFTTLIEAEMAVAECEKEDIEYTNIFQVPRLTYHTANVEEWVRIKADYQYRAGERAGEREFNDQG